MDRNQYQQQQQPYPPRPYNNNNNNNNIINNSQLQPQFNQHPSNNHFQQQQPQHHLNQNQPFPPPPPLQQDVHQQPPPQDPVHIPAWQALDLLRMHSPGMTQIDIGAFMADVEQLMRDCSQANIQAGKIWIATHCRTPQQIDILARAIVAIAISRRTFEEKLHLVYLINDVLSHSDRKQLPWIKDALYPHLVAILRVAYYFPGIDDVQKNRVIKVLGIWRDKLFFLPHVLDTLETDVKRPPLLPGGAVSGPVNSAPIPPQHPQHPHHPAIPPQHSQLQQGQDHYPPISQQQQQQQQSSMNSHGQWHPPQHQQLPPSGSYPDAIPRQQAIPNFAHGQQQQQQQQQQHYSHHQPQQQHFHPPSHQPLPPPVQPNFQAPPLHPAPSPAPVRTHRDALTRDLPAALMLSKIDSEARFYESMPSDVSIPLKRDESKQAVVLAALSEFLEEDQAMQMSEKILSPGDEGWHPGYLDQFYITVAWKRKQAFSKKSPLEDVRGRSRSRSQERSRGRGSGKERSDRRSRSFSRPRSYSRSNSRSRSRDRPSRYRQSRSRSRGRNPRRSLSPSRRGSRGDRTFSRSRSRSEDRGGRREASPKRRGMMEEAFPVRSFAGLGTGAGSGSGLGGSGSGSGSSSQPSRPMFQPARHQY